MRRRRRVRHALDDSSRQTLQLLCHLSQMHARGPVTQGWRGNTPKSTPSQLNRIGALMADFRSGPTSGLRSVE